MPDALSSTSWRIRADKGVSPESARAISGGKHALPSGGRTVSTDAGGFADVGARFPELLEAGKTRGIAAWTILESDRKQVISAGTAAEWFFQLNVNGETVLDCLEAGNGSMDGPFGHIVHIPLRKGKNIVSFFIRGGNRGVYFYFLPLPEPCPSPWLKKGLTNYLFPPETALRTRPVVFGVSHNAASVLVELKTPALIRLKYREAGTDSRFRIRQNTLYGQYRNEPCQSFRLTGLKPGTDYEYEVEASADSVKYDFSAGPCCFRTDDPEKTEHRLLLTADTHLSAVQLDAFFREFRNKLGNGPIDRFAHLGDMQGNYEDFSRFTDGYLTIQQKYVDPRIPCVFVRGNHEYFGSDSAQFVGRFGRPYGSFTLGNTYFLVLDTGWDMDGTGKCTPLRADLNALMKEERAWLLKAVRSKEWRQAKVHVVLAHATPGPDFSESIGDCIERLIPDLFLGKKPAYGIDLWLCGHTHWASRLDVKKQEYLVAYERNSGQNDSRPPRIKHYTPFPVVIANGPNPYRGDCSILELVTSRDGLRLRHWLQNGDLIDDIRLGSSGVRVLRSVMKPVR